MLADHYALFTIRNTSTIPMQVTIQDVAGAVQVVATLAPGAETTQASHVEATWTVKFAAAGEAALAQPDAASKDIGGRGGPTIH